VKRRPAARAKVKPQRKKATTGDKGSGGAADLAFWRRPRVDQAAFTRLLDQWGSHIPETGTPAPAVEPAHGVPEEPAASLVTAPGQSSSPRSRTRTLSATPYSNTQS